MLFYQFAKVSADANKWEHIGHGYYRDYTEAHCVMIGTRDAFLYYHPEAVFSLEEQRGKE